MTNHHHLSWRKVAEGITNEGSGILEPDILSSSPLILYEELGPQGG